MRHRIEVATDVARIGAWDASGAAEPFYIEIGGDWGGAVDVYVNESAPAKAKGRATKSASEGLVSVPSGRLLIAGGEDYRSVTPRTIGSDSVIEIPSGDYRVRGYVAELSEAEEAAEMSIPEAEETLDPADRDYYRSVGRADLRVGLIGYTLFLLFPLLVFPFGWKIALGVTVAAVAVYFGIFGNRSERRLKADARYQRINKELQDIFLHGQRPSLIIELFTVARDEKREAVVSEVSATALE
jgi:hypothetical protein